MSSSDIILIIFTIIASFSSVIAIYDLAKKWFTQLLRKKMRFFFESYTELNPYLIFDFNKNNIISTTLWNHYVLIYGGYPGFKHYVYNDENNLKNWFNLFWLINNDFIKNNSFYQIWQTNKFWKKLNKKILIILYNVEKLNYIVKENMFQKIYYRHRGELEHSDIQETSVSICPNFDNRKLFDIISRCGDYEEDKIKLIQFVKKSTNYNVKKKEFKKDLGSKKYCINIKFKSKKTISTYVYSILFDNDKIINIIYKIQKESELDKRDVILSEQIEWIKESFNDNNIDDKDIIEIPN